MWQAKSNVPLSLPFSWQQIQQGEKYRSTLKEAFSPWTDKILGYQILKLGGLSGEIDLDLPMRHQITIAPQIMPNLLELSQRENYSVVQSSILELPFIEQSIDACVMANVLNFSHDPHQVLREIQRVTAQDAYLFVSLFNPLSPLILKRSLSCERQHKLPFRCYPRWRVVDWLELLGFDILQQTTLSVNNELPYLAHLDLIVAQKQTLFIRPNKAHLHFSARDLFPSMPVLGTIEPSESK